MHPRTEALLTLRDGEPIDARVRDELLADPHSVAELDRLRRIKAALGELPDLEPPGGVWQRIDSELDRNRRWRVGAPLRFAAGAAIAVAAAVAAMLYLGRSPQPEEAELPTTAASGVQQQRLSAPALPASYVAVREESARLERELARMPKQRPMMKARTASTIVGLEERIAFIDEQLMLGTAQDMEIPAREVLWEERVDLMNALLLVRYAQAQQIGF